MPKTNKIKKTKTKKKSKINAKVPKKVDTNNQTMERSDIGLEMDSISKKIIISSLSFAHTKNDLNKINDLLEEEISLSEKFAIEEHKKSRYILYSIQTLTSTSAANNEHLLNLLFDISNNTIIECKAQSNNSSSQVSESHIKQIANQIEESAKIENKPSSFTINLIKDSTQKFIEILEEKIKKKDFKQIPTLEKEEINHLQKVRELKTQREEHATQKYDELKKEEIKIENKIFDANQKQKTAKTFEQKDKWSFEAKSLEKKLKKLQEKNQKIKDKIKTEFDSALKSDSLRKIQIKANIKAIILVNSTLYQIKANKNQFLFTPLYPNLIKI